MLRGEGGGGGRETERETDKRVKIDQFQATSLLSSLFLNV